MQIRKFVAIFGLVLFIGFTSSVAISYNHRIGKLTLDLGTGLSSSAAAIWGYMIGDINSQIDLNTNLYKQNWYPRIITLVGGQEDESPSGSSATIVADTSNFKIGTQGWQMQMAGAVTGQCIFDPVGVASVNDPATFPPADAVGMWIYLDDQSKITSVTINLMASSDLTESNTVSWTSSAGQLATGWNFLRAPAITGTITHWGTIYRVRVLVVTTDATNATIGHIWVECPKKARILLINDGGYNGFYTNCYPSLKALKIPITIAVAPALLGTASPPDDRITESQLATIASENNNEISFHSWDGTATTSMTAAQIRADTMKCIKWLQMKGYCGTRLWRAAWVGNLATNASAAQTLVQAYASPTNGANIGSWPPINKWNIPRVALHSLTQANMDTYFTNMQLTNSLMVCYMHSISEAGGNNITPANWAYFLNKVQTAVLAGWLEGVTFRSLSNGVDINATQTITFNPYLGAGLP